MAKKKTEAAEAVATAPAWSLDTTKPQLFAGGKPVAKITAEFWSYMEFNAALRRARADFAAADTGEAWTVFWQRARILGQMRAWDAAGARVPFDATDLMLMPVRQGVALASQIDRGIIGAAGDIVRDKKTGKPAGDGIEGPLLFKLAKPLSATVRDNNVASDIVIEEIEFFANSFGDVEAIVAADGTPDLLPALMNIAKGLIKGTPGNGSSPDVPITPAMLAGVTFPDGDAIVRLVGAAFLEPVGAG